MKVARIVAVLHDAIADLSLQLGVAIDRGNEPRDFPMPFLWYAVGELIFDHEMFHRWLLGAYSCSRSQSGSVGCNNASMDKIDTMDLSALARILKRRSTGGDDMANAKSAPTCGCPMAAFQKMISGKYKLRIASDPQHRPQPYTPTTTRPCPPATPPSSIPSP